MDAEDTGTTPPQSSTSPDPGAPWPKAAQDSSQYGNGSADTRGQSSTANTGSMSGVDLLAYHLADLARRLQASTSSHEAMQTVLAAAVHLVPGADEAAISLIRARRQVTSAAATGPAAKNLDDLQTELGQGPCLDAVFTHRSTRVDNLVCDERWPLLSARAEEIGMSSMLCLQLYVEGNDLGALNLLGAPPHAFSDASEHVGLLLAAHAAVAIANARDGEQMDNGLARRDVIGQAKGILMERFKMSPDRAFEVLARISQDQNRKLVDVAADLAATGELPPGPPAPARHPRSRSGRRPPRSPG